jgi:hypothetical protein
MDKLMGFSLVKSRECGYLRVVKGRVQLISVPVSSYPVFLVFLSLHVV